MALIDVRRACVRFDGVPAVEDASLSIQRGEYLVILGENGSGKSTLVRAILGLVKLRSGSIAYADGLRKRQIGYLPQQTAAQRDFPASVEEVVLSGCVSRMGLRPWFTKQEKERAHVAMRMLELMGMAKKSYRNLSGGQQQRTLLARALCATDLLLLLDEPVSGLDPDATGEMYGIIRKLNREQGVAVVMVSHDVDSALRDADRVLVMENSRVAYLGDVAGYRILQGEQILREPMISDKPVGRGHRHDKR